MAVTANLLGAPKATWRLDVLPTERVSRLQVSGTGNNSGRSLSGSIVGTVILSQANGVVHHGGASTVACTLGGNTLQEGDWGGLRDRLMDRSH